MSMRDFVRNILPQYQIHSPKMLASSAEKELEQEIDNDNAKIVGGDGVASGDMEAGRKALVASADVVESDGEDGKNSYPSWVRPKHWYLDSSDSSTLEIESPRPTTSDANIRRIRSAISLVLPANSSNHQLQRRTSHALLTARKMQEMQEPPPAYSAVPDDIMSSIASPPSPSIRRKQLNASHHDLTSLVNNWTQSGPANQTLLYKKESFT